MLLTLSGCGSQTQSQPQATQTSEAATLAAAQAAYLDHVDLDYSYGLAKKLEDIKSNEALGYRTAGSDAEIATGDMLKAEMESIGLSDVTKDAFTLDTWTPRRMGARRPWSWVVIRLTSPPAAPNRSRSWTADEGPRTTWLVWM